MKLKKSKKKKTESKKRAKTKLIQVSQMRFKIDESPENINVGRIKQVYWRVKA